METAVKTSRELEAEINTLHSILEAAVSHLIRVDDRLHREMQTAGKVETHASQFNVELVSNFTDFGSLFARQFQQLRVVIETTRTLSFLINDYSKCLKGGI
jgi:hypothetical protein